jgi:hypothetical protein
VTLRKFTTAGNYSSGRSKRENDSVYLRVVDVDDGPEQLPDDQHG